MTNQIRTPEELTQLKINWINDPCWEIEDTEGFEAHREELIAWREERERRMEIKRREAEDERIENIMPVIGLGISDRETILALHTFEEIEQDASVRAEDAQTHLMLCQVRATLLQAAQLKRIADALGIIADGNTRVTSKDPYAQSMLDLLKDRK